MLQYCPDPSAVFEEARRALRFPGVLIFSTLGPDSLIELRAAWAKADEHSHVTEFLDMHHVGDALVHAGFAEPVLDVEKITITYEQLPRLMADLRGVGSINATTHRNRGLTGRRAWQRMNDTYETFRNAEARLPLTLEIVFGLAWRGPPASGRRTPDGDVEIPVDRIFPRDRNHADSGPAR
jgi:malonyl-CoA O-methyltransferase